VTSSCSRPTPTSRPAPASSSAASSQATERRRFSADRDAKGTTTDGLPVYGVVAARTARMWARCGCWRWAGVGAAEPCWVCCDAGGAPGRGTGAYGERFQRIALRMLPVGRGVGAGPPGAARRMTQQSPQHQGHLVTGSGHSARGAAVRGVGAAVRGAGAGRSGAAAQPGSAAIRVTGPASCPGRHPSGRCSTRLISPALMENARTASTTSPGAGLGSGRSSASRKPPVQQGR
jgi:hypothetical protein